MKSRAILKDIMNNDNGIALPLVIMVLVVTSILGLSLMGMAVSNVKMSSGERNYQSSYYIAEAGATMALEEITSSVKEVYQDSNTNENNFFTNTQLKLNHVFVNQKKGYTNFEKVNGDTPVANVTIKPIAGTNDYTLTSEGIIGNRKRTVETSFSLLWLPKSKNFTIRNDMAVFTNGPISMYEGPTITGPIGTNSSNSKSITLSGGPTLNGDIYVGPNAEPTINYVVNKPKDMNLTNKVYTLDKVRELTMPIFPAFPTNLPQPKNVNVVKDSPNNYDVILDGRVRIDNWMTNNYQLQLTQDMYFKEIRIRESNYLYINVGNSDKRIVVDHLNIENGHIRLLGTGKLTIFVTGILNMGDSASTINKESKNNVKKLDIFLRGSGKPKSPKTVTLSGGQQVFGSLFAEDANIRFTAGSGFQGHIMTGGKSVIIDGGAEANTQLFYAPNAKFELLAGGTVKGSIISNTFHSSGGATVTFLPIKDGELPVFPGESKDNPDIAIDDILITKPIRESN